jgi:hypothetical protein
MAWNALRSGSQNGVCITRPTHAAHLHIRLSKDRFILCLPFAQPVCGRVMFVVTFQKNRD